MLVFIACLIAQIEPYAGKEITVADFIAQSEAAESANIDGTIRHLEATIKENRGKAKILADLKKRLAKLKAEKKDPPPAPPLELDFRNLKIGAVGSATYTEGDGSRTINKARVLQVISKGVLLCKYGPTDFALAGLYTTSIVDDDVIPLEGIWTVSGTLTYETVLGAKRKIPVVSSWKHEKSYTDAISAAQKAKPEKPTKSKK